MNFSPSWARYVRRTGGPQPHCIRWQSCCAQGVDCGCRPHLGPAPTVLPHSADVFPSPCFCIVWCVAVVAWPALGHGWVGGWERRGWWCSFFRQLVASTVSCTCAARRVLPGVSTLATHRGFYITSVSLVPMTVLGWTWAWFRGLGWYPPNQARAVHPQISSLHLGCPASPHIIDVSSPSPLPQGTFAKVYKAKCIEDGPHLNELVAIKALKLEAFMSSLDDIIVRTLAPPSLPPHSLPPPSLASTSLPGTT